MPLLTGCGDNDPTGVGAELVDPAELVTFEVVLDGDRFLDHAATFDGYTRTANAPFALIAREAGDTADVDAHALLRFNPPNSVNFPDSEGNLKTDTTPNYIGGTLTVRFDTAVSAVSDSVPLRLLHLTQAWDETTAGWTLRVDSAGVQIPWTTPGGTAGAVIDSAVLAPGADAVTFSVDSQSVALWAEEAGAHGVLIAADLPGTRIFATQFSLELRARPSARPDTVVSGDIPAGDETFIYSPAPDDPVNLLRLGGTPAWRVFLRFRERMDTITVEVPFEDGTVRIPLSEATVNFASLELSPVTVPPAFRPESNIQFAPHAAVESDLIPLARSPVGARLTVRPQLAQAAAFTGADGSVDGVEMPLSSFVENRLQPPNDDSGEGIRSIVLVPATETFGFGAFPSAGENGPRLRLVLTVVKGDDS